MKTVKIWHLVFILGLINILGCKKLLLMHFQVKNPKIENSASIQKFIQKKELQIDEYFTFSYEGFDSRIGDLSYPGIEIYTRDGKYVPYPGEESCKVGASEFIEILKNPLQFPTSDSLNLKNLTRDLRTKDGGELNYKQASNTDYVIVIYWAKFVGKLNGRDIEGWRQNVKNNSESNFDVLMVNCDYQEWWGEENLRKSGIKN